MGRMSVEEVAALWAASQRGKTFDRLVVGWIVARNAMERGGLVLPGHYDPNGVILTLAEGVVDVTYSKQESDLRSLDLVTKSRKARGEPP